MYATYHLASAQEINSDILDAIKAAFKTKAITIIIEEDETDRSMNPVLTTEMISILDERLEDTENEYITTKESITHLKKKYEL